MITPPIRPPRSPTRIVSPSSAWLTVTDAVVAIPPSHCGNFIRPCLLTAPLRRSWIVNWCSRQPRRGRPLIERGRLERSDGCANKLLDGGGGIAAVGLTARQASDALGRHQRVVKRAQQK